MYLNVSPDPGFSLKKTYNERGVWEDTLFAWLERHGHVSYNVQIDKIGRGRQLNIGVERVFVREEHEISLILFLNALYNWNDATSNASLDVVVAPRRGLGTSTAGIGAG